MNWDFERFWAKVNMNGPLLVPELGRCWQWTGAKNWGGYGYFGKITKRGRERIVRAHRFIWESVYGLIPTEMNVLHRCDNPFLCQTSAFVSWYSERQYAGHE